MCQQHLTATDSAPLLQISDDVVLIDLAKQHEILHTTLVQLLLRLALLQCAEKAEKRAERNGGGTMSCSRWYTGGRDIKYLHSGGRQERRLAASETPKPTTGNEPANTA